MTRYSVILQVLRNTNKNGKPFTKVFRKISTESAWSNINDLTLEALIPRLKFEIHDE